MSKHKKFRPIDTPNSWRQYWSRYPEGFSIIEAVIDWVSHVNALTDNVNDWNEYLDEFVEKFDDELQGTVISVLEDWQESGKLEVIVAEALDTQVRELERLVEDMNTWITENSERVDQALADNQQQIDDMDQRMTQTIEDLDQRISDNIDRISDEIRQTINSELKIHMFDVARHYSQDCILVQAGDKNILIDYGLHGDVPEVAGKIQALGVTKIHYTYITHYHGDHYGGARRFIEETALDFSECVAYVPPQADWSRLVNTSGTGSTAELLSTQEADYRSMLTENNIPWTVMTDGMTVDINEETSLTFRNVGNSYWSHYYNAEFNDNAGGADTDYNDFSIIGIIKHGERHALLASDAAYTAQGLNARHIPSSLMFYQIPHHSLDKVVHPDWSRKVVSDVVFISNARRDGSITSRQEYAEHRDKGSEIYSTGMSGDISFRKTIEGVSVKAENGQAIRGTNAPMLTGGRQILRGTDLNDLTDPGTYVSDSMGNTDSLINTPESMQRGGFKMVVEQYHHETRRRQTLYEVSGRGMIFYRVWSTNNQWNRWIRVLNDQDLEGESDGVVRNLINTDDDLNNYTSYGRYTTRVNSVAQTVLNRPSDVNGAFTMDVIPLHDVERFYQHLRVHNGLGDEYTRTYVGSWQPWFKITKTRID